MAEPVARADPPKSPDWRVAMRWSKLLFAHWPIDPTLLQPLVHRDVQVDTFNGAAWIGVIPFVMSDIRLRGLPPIPGARRFLELNVRSYVRHRSERAVWFFSLDAASLPAVLAARAWYRLNYRWATMDFAESPDQFRTLHYTSRRRAGDAALDIRYRPADGVIEKSRDSLAHFLAERYQLLTLGRGGRLFRAKVHHAPWTLRPADARFAMNTMTRPLGLSLPDTEPHLMFAEPVDVVADAPALLR